MTEAIFGSGNVFADLGFSDPETEQRKSDLAGLIWEAMMIAGLTKPEAAAKVGLTTRDFDRVINGRTGNYSVVDLREFLAALTPSSERSPS